QGDQSNNLSPFYGAVAFTHDGQLDRPLSVTRLRYSTMVAPGTLRSIAPVTYHPFWNVYGQSEQMPVLPPEPIIQARTDNQVHGRMADCFAGVFTRIWYPYRGSSDWHASWQGTLLEDKLGTGGLMYRRNRYYDSESGRFTQEDPIGLAGGLNLYGFADGD